MPFVYHRRVQFAETDLAGIVHFSMYFRYMEEAEHALWRTAGLSIVDRGTHGDATRTAPVTHVGFPRVAASCEYLAPLGFEDEIDVHVRLDHAGRRSLRYAHTIQRGETTVATGTMTVVCVEHAPTGMRTIEIPQRIVQTLRDTLKD